MSALHLHVGIDPRLLVAAVAAVAPHRLIIDGDGWESWGEAIGAESNDDRTLHVIVEFDGYTSDQRARDAALDLIGCMSDLHLLTRMRKAGPDSGVVGCLSDAADWSTLDGGRVHVWRADGTAGPA